MFRPGYKPATSKMKDSKVGPQWINQVIRVRWLGSHCGL